MAEQKEFTYEYNPVKEITENTEAVIWTTKALNIAVDAINKGLPLKSNPFCGKNTKLLKPDLVYKRTQEEIDDYIHCMNDPVYFASKCYLMTPEGLQNVELRDYQENYLHHLQSNRFSIWLACRQCGKCQTLDSEIVIKVDKSKIPADTLNKISYFNIYDDIYRIPMFELYNLWCNKTWLWKIEYHLYKMIYKVNHIRHKNKFKSTSNVIRFLLSMFDSLNYSVIKQKKLLDGYKVIDDISIDRNWFSVLTDSGFKPISDIMITKPFDQYTITLDNGYSLTCADEHIVFDSDYNEVYVKNLSVGDMIQTDTGAHMISSIVYNPMKVSMVDITVDDVNHRFYSNGILSHNSVTTAIYCLWKILFSIDKQGLILSKSGPAGVDLLKKIKDMFMNLPYHLKCGINQWNQHSISFDNNSSISTEAFSPTAGLGKTINFLILDEFAWCPPNDVELFYNNIIPTITTISDSNVCIMSTQNGFNLFYKLYTAAVQKKNIYKPFKTDWWQVPQWNTEKKIWEKRTEEWHQMLVGVLGSEEAFQYQYGTEFSSSDYCLVSRPCIARLRDNAVLFENIPEPTYNTTHPECLFVDPRYDIRNFKTDFFLILCDLAEGGGGDSTVFNIFRIMDNDNYEQVGYWKSNIIDLEHAALEFWLTFQQLFNQEHIIVSIEWNTYGALFYNYLSQLNDTDYNADTMGWRFYYGNELDMSIIARYKKGDNTEDIAGINLWKNSKTIPGIRFNGSNKVTGCALLKMALERGNIIYNDLVQISELENFEDKSGNGSYKASYGHDDMMMTTVQIPMVKQTARFKEFMEDMAEFLAGDSYKEKNGWS